MHKVKRLYLLKGILHCSRSFTISKPTHYHSVPDYSKGHSTLHISATYKTQTSAIFLKKSTAMVASCLEFVVQFINFIICTSYNITYTFGPSVSLYTSFTKWMKWTGKLNGSPPGPILNELYHSNDPFCPPVLGTHSPPRSHFPCSSQSPLTL
jgi:hypothetical protein